MTIVQEIGAAIERMGWSEAARRTGVDRTQLHRAFGARGKASLSTIKRVLPALGLRLVIERIEQ